MSRYRTTEYNVGSDGRIEAVVMSQMDIPGRLIKDAEEGRVHHSGPVEHPSRDAESQVTVVWGPKVYGDGSRRVLAWYDSPSKGTVRPSR